MVRNKLQHNKIYLGEISAKETGDNFTLHDEVPNSASPSGDNVASKFRFASRRVG